MGVVEKMTFEQRLGGGELAKQISLGRTFQVEQLEKRP